jgi:hypothetical protein
MSSRSSGLKISRMESRGGGVDFATFVILSLDGRNGHNKKARPGAIVALETDPEPSRLLRDFPWRLWPNAGWLPLVDVTWGRYTLL